MINVGRHNFKPWLRGFAAAPRKPGVVCLVRTFHANKRPEVLHVQAAADLRGALGDFTARRGPGPGPTDRLSAAIVEHGLPGSGVQLAALECADLGEARRIARDLLSAAKKSAPVAKRPDVSELVRQVRALHAEVVSQEQRAILREVRDLLKGLV